MEPDPIAEAITTLTGRVDGEADLSQAVLLAHQHLEAWRLHGKTLAKQRRATMRTAVLSGVDRNDLADLTGMTRQRVQQIIEMPTARRVRKAGEL